MFRNVGVAVALFLLADTAPGQTFRIPASNETLKAVKSTRVMLTLKQDEIIADYVRPRSSGPITPQANEPKVSRGFLTDLIIGLAIDAAADAVSNEAISAGRAKRAEEQSEPVRKALQGYAFRSGYELALAEKLRAVDWLNVTEIRYAPKDSPVEEMRKDATETALLLVTTRYSLSPGLRYLRIWCAAVLLPNNDTLRNIATQERPDDKFFRLYRNQFMYWETVDKQAAKPDEAAARWSANNGERIRAAMNEGITEITRLIALDLQDFAAQAEKTDAAKQPSKTVRYAGQDATVLSETEKRHTLRLPNGTLRSAPKNLLAAE